jgi:hypothetical protein
MYHFEIIATSLLPALAGLIHTGNIAKLKMLSSPMRRILSYLSGSMFDPKWFLILLQLTNFGTNEAYRATGDKSWRHISNVIGTFR